MTIWHCPFDTPRYSWNIVKVDVKHQSIIVLLILTTVFSVLRITTFYHHFDISKLSNLPTGLRTSLSSQLRIRSILLVLLSFVKTTRNLSLIAINKLPVSLINTSHWLVVTICCKTNEEVSILVFNAISNNISIISWWSVLLVEETGENHRNAASYWQTLSHNVV